MQGQAVQYFKSLTGVDIQGIEFVVGVNMLSERVYGMVQAVLGKNVRRGLGAGQLQTAKLEGLQSQGVCSSLENVDVICSAASAPAGLKFNN